MLQTMQTAKDTGQGPSFSRALSATQETASLSYLERRMARIGEHWARDQAYHSISDHCLNLG